MSRFSLHVALIILFSASISASASPVLLASYNVDASGGGGSGPMKGPFVDFVLQLPSSPPFGSPVDPSIGIGMNQSWYSGATGYFDFTADNDPYFVAVAARATDGIDDWLGVYTQVGGHAFRESEFFSKKTDLVGYEIDFIRLTVNQLYILPLPQIGGYEPYWNVSYDFYGTPVPEPSSIGLLGLGMAICLAKPRQSKAKRV